MIKKVNRICGKLNKALGISVSLPDPDEKTLEKASRRNLVLGTGLAAAGVVLHSRTCLLLGGAGMVSGTVLRRENRKRRSRK